MPGRGQLLPLPHQRPAVERRRPTVDLEDDRRRVALRVRRSRDEPALDAVSVDLVPALHRRDELDVRPRGHEVADLPKLDPIVAAQPAGGNVANDDLRRARPGRLNGGQASAAARQADEGRAREVMPVAREPLETPPIHLDAPQLEGAVDGRGEGDPAAVGHPRGPQRQPAHQVAAHGACGLEVGLGDQVLRMAVTRPDAPDRCLRQLAAAPVASADRGDPPAIRGPRRGAPRLLPATRRELTHRPAADVDEVDVAAPAEVRVRVAVRDEGDLPPIRRPLRIGVVVVATRQELGGAALGVDQPDTGEPLVDEARAVELVAQRVDESRVGRGAILRLALRLPLGIGRVGRADDRQPATVR